MVGAGNSSQSIEGVSGWIAATGGGLNYAFILYTYTAANVHCRIRGCMHPSQRLRFHVDRKAGVGDS